MLEQNKFFVNVYRFSNCFLDLYQNLPWENDVFQLIVDKMRVLKSNELQIINTAFWEKYCLEFFAELSFDKVFLSTHEDNKTI